MIRAVNVSKVFHGSFVVVDVNLDIYDNERIGIIGVHNSGKTVLLQMLAGDMKPTKGKVYLEDKRKIAYIPQVPKFIPTLSVKDVIGYVNKEYRYLDLVGLDGSKKVKNLSLDEKKRLSLALSLPFSPNHLIVDDLSQISFLTRDLIRRFKGCVVIAHHNLKDIWDLIDRVVILSKGRVVFDGPKDKLLYKVIRFENNEVWESKDDNSIESELDKRGTKYEIVEVTPDETFLHFYAGI
ncbi:ATP-binding cassette domain-containing protein [Sulfolobus sp. E11-6]|uniref:ATP-binding cassette domain-containing protein n=1 Tax=Sulfolobus sp. E11-6 TaxID=2663020 RepID=UPI0012957633|nr:ABC transporter ATP-binding protein [Sulfolobus sp. E11-6]QGA68071.1 ATP-binding cassette domain-containing protein [Sulfolobus sp. E11-6]